MNRAVDVLRIKAFAVKTYNHSGVRTRANKKERKKMMKYDVIKQKLESGGRYAIIGEKEIQHGICLTLNNGCLVNCYTKGTHSCQGKNSKEVGEFLDNMHISNVNRKIFVVYGHDEIAKTQLEALLRRWDLDPIILDQQASSGQTIIQKLEECSKDVGYAIVLATPDDEGRAKNEEKFKSRVRQNVALELGMFLAKLGREKVAILLKEDVNFERPSDIQGLIYIPFQNKVDEVTVSLVRELSKQGYTIDSSKL